MEVTGGRSYVRKNPSLKGKQLCVLSKGDTAEYLGKSSVDDRGVTWYSVRTSAGDGWISSKYTKLGASSKPSGSETATTGSTVEVVGGSTNVRRYPSLDGKKLYVLSKGDTAEYLSKTSVDDRGDLVRHSHQPGRGLDLLQIRQAALSERRLKERACEPSLTSTPGRKPPPACFPRPIRCWTGFPGWNRARLSPPGGAEC